MTSIETTAWIRDKRNEHTWDGREVEKHVIRKELLLLYTKDDGQVIGYLDDADHCTFGIQECHEVRPLADFPLPSIQRLADLEGPEVEENKTRLDKIIEEINSQTKP